MKRIHLLTLMCILFGCLFLLHPQISHQGVMHGLSLCVSAILPTIFPCLVLSDLLISETSFRPCKRLCCILHLSPNLTAAWITGIIAGYPSGARTICKCYTTGKITKEQAHRALYVCNNAGPAFVIGVIGGGVFHSVSAGIILYALHLAASVLMAQFLRSPDNFDVAATRNNPKSSVSSIITAIGSAAETTLTICGYLMFFSIITEHLQSIIPPVWQKSQFWPLILGSIELTSGVHALSRIGIALEIKWILSAALIGWGGFCVHGQTIHLLNSCDLSAKTYLTGKCIHCIVSTYLIVLLLPWLCPSIQNSMLWYIPHVLLAACMIIFLAAKSSSGKKTFHPL